MQFITFILDLFLHLDVHLNQLVVSFGSWVYGILFLIVFCETGLVVTPFLPGDSLLFAVGALAAIDGSPLDLRLLALVFFLGALCGDCTNYNIGRHFGPRLFQGREARFFNREHFLQTQAFYNRHGGKTVILARFAPIIRTFAPFVAGLGQMPFRRFISFSAVGAGLWIVPFLVGGYELGASPVVKTNFHIVVLAICGISVMPAVLQFFKARRQRVETAQSANQPGVAPPSVKGPQG